MSLAAVKTRTLGDQLFDAPGYTMLRLSELELLYFRQAIERRVSARINETYWKAGLENYHAVDHRSFWAEKKNRLLPKKDVEMVKHFGFLQAIRKQLGAFRILPVIYGGRVHREDEEVYWRIVRPNEENDVAEIHADTWYHGDFKDEKGPLLEPGEWTLKCWIALAVESGKNGLGVVPNSHKEEWRVGEMFDDSLNRMRRWLIGDSPKLQLLDTEPGDVVLFNDKLLHGGVVNQGSTTRVSAEITLVFG